MSPVLQSEKAGKGVKPKVFNNTETDLFFSYLLDEALKVLGQSNHLITEGELRTVLSTVHSVLTGPTMVLKGSL